LIGALLADYVIFRLTVDAAYDIFCMFSAMCDNINAVGLCVSVYISTYYLLSYQQQPQLVLCSNFALLLCFCLAVLFFIIFVIIIFC